MTGLDFTDSMLDRAREKALAAGADVDLRKGTCALSTSGAASR